MEQFVRTFPFQALRQPTDRQLWRDRHKQMNMILGYMPFQNFHTLMATNIPDHFPRSIDYIPHKDWLAILGYPHQMQMNGKNTMGTMPIFVHAPKLTQEMLKLPAKAGGFDPPKGRQ
jgi:hypothetical protein